MARRRSQPSPSPELGGEISPVFVVVTFISFPCYSTMMYERDEGRESKVANCVVSTDRRQPETVT